MFDGRGFETIKFEEVDDVLIVTIDHPSHDWNLVDDALHGDLVRLMSALKSGCDSRAILLKSQGRAFSGGGNFDWFESLRSVPRLTELSRHARQIVWDFLDVEVPVVVAVNGHAVGLGASIALLSDVIFMGESARISDPHVRAGIVAGDGGTVVWPLAIGPARAKEMLMTGDAVTAEQAYSWGLVNHVVPDALLESEAFAFAKRLASGAPLAIQQTKMAVNRYIKSHLSGAFDTATAYEMLTFLSADHREAVAAFKEKRSPIFHGE